MSFFIQTENFPNDYSFGEKTYFKPDSKILDFNFLRTGTKNSKKVSDNDPKNCLNQEQQKKEKTIKFKSF